MDQQRSFDDPQRPKLLGRALRWLDARTGVIDLTEKILHEEIPGGARLAYVFGSGLLFIFLLQIVTGICLAIYYVPSAGSAHTSVAYIVKQVEAGAFLRSMHSYGSSAMMIVLLLHFLQTFLFGSFKGRRELLWMSGALLSFLVLGMSFTGYLLPWDQKAYFATAVGTNIVGGVPFIGGFLSRILRGGEMIGTLTISRFYAAHVFLIPGTILLFVASHVFLFRKAGAAGPVDENPVSPKLATETFYPRQVLMDMAFALLIIVVLGVLSYFRPTTLGPVANPADTAFLPRPEWYYLPMFEWLKLWEGPAVVIGVVVLPGLLALLFFLLPFLDRTLERRPWRRPIPVLAVSIVVLGMISLGVKSRLDDRKDPVVARQLDAQEQQEMGYSNAPFEPDVEGGDRLVPASNTTKGNEVLARGRGIFVERGCSACHGEFGQGTALAPNLAGITERFPAAQLAELLHNPSPKMRAGRMPAVDIAASSMSALITYLGVVGTNAAHIAPALPTSPAPQAANVGDVKPGASISAASAQMPRRGDKAGNSISAARGEHLFQTHACFACHGASGAGGRLPALATLIAKISDEQLIHLLQHPSSKMRTGGMPPVAASPDEISSVVAFLRTLPAPLPPKLPVTEAATVKQARTSVVPEPQSQR